MTSDQEIIDATRRWIETVVVKNDFCPFAGRELARDSIIYRVTRASEPEACLQALGELCQQLDAAAERETALLICADAFAGFDDYLDMVDLAERLLQLQGYEGIYQLASFHPDYRFAGADGDDAANYTNRSPYPMLHLLRESSIEQALQHYPAAEAIPDRNIETARRIGLAAMQQSLNACRGDRNAG
ncbi:MAG: DUF1415 domain-containing protein [Thiogranum sp.]|nr:DUF1415 domain-containing protein [Thiogranum sp.]